MPNTKNRKLNRLKDYNYAQDGWYFVTICAKNREYFFGKIINGEMRLSKIGKTAEKFWQEIVIHFPDVKLDEFIIMPNHIHGIIIIENPVAVGNKNVGNKNFCSLPNRNNNYCSPRWQTRWARSLSSVIRGFKIGVKKWCGENDYEHFAWQKSFYDHIIRHEKSLNKIREYIINNPLKWELDRNNPENLLM
ncbi:MAG: transposase [Patescibacteria group bacterium]